MQLDRLVVLAVLIVLEAAAVIAFVLHLLPRFRPQRPSMDDIPLSEIEMPGEK
jgi:hypothetical protein